MTAAARAEAERIWPPSADHDLDLDLSYPRSALRELVRAAFAAGASWQAANDREDDDA